MKLTLHIWRQKDQRERGKIVRYEMDNVNPEMSFLEMLDVLNEQLEARGEMPVAFDHDCREGICGACSMTINGIPHGNDHKTKHSVGTTACQIHMRRFKDGDQVYIEPFRAKAFPVVRDLVVDRTAFDRIIASGGFVSVNTGSVRDANNIPIGRETAAVAMDAAACIGCGACVAACKNASAMLFVSAKVSHLALLPQGQIERAGRVQRMVAQMDREGFGNCTNYYECEAVCPKEINRNFIARMNREYLSASVKKPENADAHAIAPQGP